MNRKKRNRADHYGFVSMTGEIWHTRQRRWRSAAYKARRAIRRGKHAEGGR